LRDRARDDRTGHARRHQAGQRHHTGLRRRSGGTFGFVSPSDLQPPDLIDIDHLLSDEEKQIRSVAREWVQRRILPEVEDWYEKGEFPARELAKEVGGLGFFLMQLDTEWTLGLNSVAY